MGCEDWEAKVNAPVTLQFVFAVEYFIKTNKLKRLVFLPSLKNVIAVMKSHLLYESAIYFPRELSHMLMYACLHAMSSLTRTHTQPSDNCWSLNFAVYLQTGVGSVINHPLWQISLACMQAHEPCSKKGASELDVWGLAIFPANLRGCWTGKLESKSWIWHQLCSELSWKGCS